MGEKNFVSTTTVPPDNNNKRSNDAILIFPLSSLSFSLLLFALRGIITPSSFHGAIVSQDRQQRPRSIVLYTHNSPNLGKKEKREESSFFLHRADRPSPKIKVDEVASAVAVAAAAVV